MERSGRHPPKAANAVIRAALVSEETGSAFHPINRGVLYTAIYGTVSGFWLQADGVRTDVEASLTCRQQGGRPLY